ncbi:MAG TPA: diaminopimelate epimerase [Alphaproteobacteria bacterium]|nr:diaminopimelate epimerase [Alphaproteobacteria bacterium]
MAKPAPMSRPDAAADPTLEFVKMHGLGNDFVVLDGRARPLALDARRAAAIADRRTGIGCDQLIVLEPAHDARADAFMRIRNADGGEVEACGNAARCIASRLMDETGRTRATIETVAGLLEAERRGADIAVDLGPVRLDWRDIPLARAMDTGDLDFARGPLAHPVAVNVGNPHAVFFVDDVDAIDLATLGPAIEHDPLFPERVNVEVVEALAPTRLRMRVWERGAGITRACGTGAAASLVAAHRRGLAGRKATVLLDGGPLEIEWRADNHVIMTGPVATSFAGRIDPALLR